MFNQMNKITIDPEFRDLLPPLTPDQFSTLEANIIQDGCTTPLVLWNGTLIDGHNRYEICTRHNLPFQVNYMEFPDRESAMDWMDANQLGRRNLSPDAFRLALGRRYNRTKKAAGSNLPQNRLKDQIDTLEPTNTAAKLAAEHSVSEATVKRAGKFAEEVAATPELQKAIAEGKPVRKARKPATPAAPVQPPDDEYTAPDDAPNKPAKLPKLTHDMTDQFLPVAILHIDRIAYNDVKFEWAMKEIISHCEKRLERRK